jgi:hypothetical protein
MLTSFASPQGGAQCLRAAGRALRCVLATKAIPASWSNYKKKPAGRKMAGKGDLVSGDSSLPEPWPRRSFRRDECVCGQMRISRRSARR